MICPSSMDMAEVRSDQPRSARHLTFALEAHHKHSKRNLRSACCGHDRLAESTNKRAGARLSSLVCSVLEASRGGGCVAQTATWFAVQYIGSSSITGNTSHRFPYRVHSSQLLPDTTLEISSTSLLSRGLGGRRAFQEEPLYILQLQFPNQLV